MFQSLAGQARDNLTKGALLLLGYGLSHDQEIVVEFERGAHLSTIAHPSITHHVD